MSIHHDAKIVSNGLRVARSPVIWQQRHARAQLPASQLVPPSLSGGPGANKAHECQSWAQYKADSRLRVSTSLDRPDRLGPKPPGSHTRDSGKGPIALSVPRLYHIGHPLFPAENSPFKAGLAS